MPTAGVEAVSGLSREEILADGAERLRAALVEAQRMLRAGRPPAEVLRAVTKAEAIRAVVFAKTQVSLIDPVPRIRWRG